MKTKFWFGSVILLGLVACGGTKNETTVTGADEASLKSSPAGVATMSFMDIESIRPDNANLEPATALPGGGLALRSPAAATTDGCRTFDVHIEGTSPNQNRVVQVTYTHCTAANGWTLNGTVTCTSPLANPGHYTTTYALTATEGTKSCSYTGTKLLTVDFETKTATLTLPADTTFVVAYADSQNASANKVYHYVPDLTADWSTAGQFKLYGSYTFTRVTSLTDNTVVSTLTAAVAEATPLLWTTGCNLPISGTITLTMGDSVVNAVFGPTCGEVRLNGALVHIGQ